MAAFSLFQRKIPSRSQDISQEDLSFGKDQGGNAIPKTYESIVKNIARYQENIANKTAAGFGLSHQIAESVEYNKFQRQQMYEIFITKMDQLYKSEMRFKRKQNKKLQQQRLAPLYSPTPLKDILRNYNEMTSQGFNSEVVQETLQNMNRALRARGYNPRTMNDYTHLELEQSWRMQKVIDDIIFGLREDQFYSPAHLAQTNNLLADMGYKNTDLIPQVFKKLQSQLDERFSGKREYQPLRFEDAVYGGPANFVSRHYVFKGFQDSDEFNTYINILLQYENNREQRSTQTAQEQDTEVAELERAMKDTIDAAVQVKELQKDFQATIENIRTQYFLLQESMDKHAFLQDNEYLRYDLLELQEMLVKAGYMNPDEASKHLANEPFDQKMDRAAHVFYDYVLNYAPELLSPQHNTFYEAAINGQRSEQSVKQQAAIEETQNQLGLATLSQTLVGLSRQALSFRRDVARKDYLHKFYEQYLMPLEQYKVDKDKEKERYEFVLMERSYLKGWKIFKEESEKLLPYLQELVEIEKDQLSGQLNALHALAACRFDEPKLREKIVDNSLRLLKTESGSINHQAIKNGLLGLAESATLNDKARELANQLATKLQVKDFGFSEQVDVLWSLFNLEQYNASSASQIIDFFNTLKFERLDHDLKYSEFTKLIDIMNALRIEGNGSLQITNPTITAGLTGKRMYEIFRYRETEHQYDPFKRRVVEALGRGLSSASINHQTIIEDELVNEKNMDAQLLNPEKYPYNPDVVMGYKGCKLGVFVLPDTAVMRDTQKADGTHRFQMRLLERASKGEIQSVVVSVPKVVHVDIPNLKVELNKQFNFVKEIEEQAKLKDHDNLANFSLLSDFGHKFITQGGDFAGSLPTQREVARLDAFVKKMIQIFQLKQETDLKFEPEQRNVGYDDLRFQLMKLNFMHDGLSPRCKEHLAQFMPSQHSSFKQMLLTIAQSIKQEEIVNKVQLPDQLDASWLGTRLEVELPNKLGQKATKSIVPEIINQRFMWVEDYFHYKDWQVKQQEVYDNFNLLQIPPHKNAAKYFFDQDNYHRRIPSGVFPHPAYKRSLLQPYAQQFQLDVAKTQGVHDELVFFEKEPYKMMVQTELKKSETLKPIDKVVSMITNLQNIKQGLKSDYSDREILNTILLNLNFTEQLIDEHLAQLKDTKQQDKGEVKKQPQFLDRDAKEYRKFVESTYYSKDREDPYSHFYLKEGAMKEAMKKELEKEQVLERELEDLTPDLKVIAEGEKRREKLWDKIDKVLLDERIKNEDLMNLSSSLKQTVNINYDMKSLVKSEFVYDMEPELQDPGLTHNEYLLLARRRAESKLIKMKIIYKMNQGNQQLTQKETLYLKSWINDISSNEQRNVLNLRDSLLPKTESKLAMSDIDAKNYYALNTISKVQFDRDQHGEFALNDLVLELSHFLDEEVINKVETQMYSDRLSSEWGLSKDFKVIETRNKEISLVLNEFEELAYRTAGILEEKDIENVKKMLSVKRNKDIFDQAYFELDMQSYENFVQTVNDYDDRIKLLERWIVRKEEEIKDRVVLPPANLRKTEQQLFTEYDKSLKQAREKLVAQLLTQDEAGNPINKAYKDLTSRELNIISENLAVRLYLFNYEYPKFLPQMIKAVMEHPNTRKSDKSLIDVYCKIFELDWRGDQTLENKDQYMMYAPIYVDGTNLKSYGEITPEKLQERIRQACGSFVEETTQKLLNYKL